MILHDFIQLENENEFPNEQYHLEERVHVMGLKTILEKVLSKHDKKETIQNEKTMKLRKKLWDDYLANRKNFKTDKEFVNSWCKTRNKADTYDELKFVKSTASKLLAQFKSNEGVVYTQKRLG